MPITSQAHLRPLRDDDAEEILDAFQSGPEGMSRQGDVVDDESARRYIQRFADNAAMDAAVVANTNTGQLLGLVTVMRDGTNRSGWFAYWMHPRSRGRGLATRAALAMASSELTDGGLERLELGHRANNPASGAVARGAGFILEGVPRQVVGRISLVLNVGVVGSARPRCTSLGRFHEMASWGRSSLYSIR